MKIAFMGSPEFAIPTLKALLDSEHEVVAIYTKEPKKAGRGMQETCTPVAKLAIEQNLNLCEPPSLKNTSPPAVDLIVVAAYGLLLPESFLSTPKYGCVNLHPSLLPKWRGASPIQRAIMNKDSHTGMTFMYMAKELDAGDILAQHPIPIHNTDTAETLHNKLAQMGAEKILPLIDDLVHKRITPTPQDHQQATYAHKIKKEETLIHWNNSIADISAIIRAFSPYPGAYFMLNNKRVKILEANYQQTGPNKNTGLLSKEGKLLKVTCIDGIVEPIILQPEGKSTMRVADFINGIQNSSFPIDCTQ